MFTYRGAAPYPSFPCACYVYVFDLSIHLIRTWYVCIARHVRGEGAGGTAGESVSFKQ